MSLTWVQNTQVSLNLDIEYPSISILDTEYHDVFNLYIMSPRCQLYLYIYLTWSKNILVSLTWTQNMITMSQPVHLIHRVRIQDATNIPVTLTWNPYLLKSDCWRLKDSLSGWLVVGGWLVWAGVTEELPESVLGPPLPPPPCPGASPATPPPRLRDKSLRPPLLLKIRGRHTDKNIEHVCLNKSS